MDGQTDGEPHDNSPPAKYGQAGKKPVMFSRISSISCGVVGGHLRGRWHYNGIKYTPGYDDLPECSFYLYLPEVLLSHPEK